MKPAGVAATVLMVGAVTLGGVLLFCIQPGVVTAIRDKAILSVIKHAFHVDVEKVVGDAVEQAVKEALSEAWDMVPMVEKEFCEYLDGNGRNRFREQLCEVVSSGSGSTVRYVVLLGLDCMIKYPVGQVPSGVTLDEVDHKVMSAEGAIVCGQDGVTRSSGGHSMRQAEYPCNTVRVADDKVDEAAVQLNVVVKCARDGNNGRLADETLKCVLDYRHTPTGWVYVSGKNQGRMTGTP